MAGRLRRRRRSKRGRPARCCVESEARCGWPAADWPRLAEAAAASIAATVAPSTIAAALVALATTALRSTLTTATLTTTITAAPGSLWHAVQTRQVYINAPEGCPHGTHTNRTAYTRGTHSREHTQTRPVYGRHAQTTRLTGRGWAKLRAARSLFCPASQLAEG